MNDTTMNDTPKINDGGPAFPNKDEFGNMIPGMTLLDWFAGRCEIEMEELSQFSQCDDQDLLQRFGTTEEIEEGFRFVSSGETQFVSNILLRALLESRGRAALRYLEAEAMIAEKTRRENLQK